MEKKFSKAWKSSKQPRKQRKYVANAPLHIRREFLSSHLSKELIEKYKTRSMTVRKGDTVKIMRGQYKKKSGKITKVNLTKIKVYVEGAEIVKKDGNKIPYPISPSNLLIETLFTEDKRRFKRK